MVISQPLSHVFERIAPSMPMSIVLTTTSPFRIQLNKRIDAHNRNTSLDCALQLLHFTHTWLQHARANLIDHFPPRKIQAVVFVVAVFGVEFLLGFFFFRVTAGAAGIGRRGGG